MFQVFNRNNYLIKIDVKQQRPRGVSNSLLYIQDVDDTYDNDDVESLLAVRYSFLHLKNTD